MAVGSRAGLAKNLFLILLFFGIFFSGHTEERKVVRDYKLSPYLMDLAIHWDKMENFPVAKYYLWSDEVDQIRQRANGGGGRLIPFPKVKVVELVSKLKIVVADLGYTLSPSDLTIVHKANPVGYTLKLNVPLACHQQVNRFNTLMDRSYYSSGASQINIGFTLVSAPIAWVREKGLDGLPANDGSSNSYSSRMSPEQFAELEKMFKENPDVKIIARNKVTTLNGQTATFKDVEERYLPESYGVDGYTKAVTKTETDEDDEVEREVETVTTNAMAIFPEFGDITELGTIMSVRPVRMPGSEMIELDLQPKVREFCGWSNFSKAYDIRMPVVRLASAETVVILADKETICLSAVYDRALSQVSKKLTEGDKDRRISEETCLLMYVTPMMKSSEATEFSYDIVDNLPGQMQMIMYPGEAMLAREIQNMIDPDKKDDEASLSHKVKQLLLESGVKFPKGSKFHYDVKQSVLIAYNTPENLQKIQKMAGKVVTVEQRCRQEAKRRGEDWEDDIDEEYLINPNVRITSGAVEISPALEKALEVGKLLSNKSLSRAQFGQILRGIAKDKDSFVRCVNTQQTLSGQTSTSKSVLEVYFPEAYALEMVAKKPVRMPEWGDITEIGTIFSVTPTVMPGSTDIELDLQPKIRSFRGWQPFAGAIKGMPIIKLTAVETVVINGEDFVTIISEGINENGHFSKKTSAKDTKRTFWFTLSNRN